MRGSTSNGSRSGADTAFPTAFWSASGRSSRKSAPRFDHRGAIEGAAPEVLERTTRVGKAVERDLGSHRNARRHLEKIDAVLARQVRDGANHAFAPKELIRE